MKSKIKTLICIITAVSIILMQSIVVSASQNGECGDGVYWEIKNGTLRIYGEGEMKDYQTNFRLDDPNAAEKIRPWNDEAENITSVIVEEGVTYIGDSAFFDFQNVRDITIAESVEWIGSPMLSNGYELESITFKGAKPDGLEGDIICDNSSFILYCPEKYYKQYKTITDYVANNAIYGLVPTIKIFTEEAETKLDSTDIELSEENPSKKINVISEYEDIDVDWRSFNENIAMVNQNGVVTAGEKPGRTVIYAEIRYDDEYFLISCQVSNKRNDILVNMLPVKGITADFPAIANSRIIDSETGIASYGTSKFVEKDTTNSTYREILAITEDITKGCSTDREKAVKIQKWVSGYLTGSMNLAIGNSVGQIYAVYKEKNSHCQGFSYLTGMMLYMAGIPNAIVSTIDHMWNLALVEGEWMHVDSTFGMSGFDDNDPKHDAIITICFAMDDCIFVIDDYKYLKLAGIGANSGERDEIKSAKIPDFVTAILGRTCSGCDNLSEITVPASVKRIDKYAIEGDGLETIYFGGTKKQWENIGYKAYGLEIVFENGEVIREKTYQESYNWEITVEDYIPEEDEETEKKEEPEETPKNEESGEAEIRVIVKDKLVEFDCPPMIVNDRTMVPFRAIFEALGAEVDWGSATQTVMAKKDDTVIILNIGSDIMLKNNETVKLDSPAFIAENRTLVPVRAISEALDLSVKWYPDSRLVVID